MKYQGKKTREISFPLGGIGSGCIGLAGNGGLIDWEIFNRPSKGSVNGFTHIAVKAESNGTLLDERVLQGDSYPPFSGQYGGDFGHGERSEKMAGFPHFEKSDFEGEFPFATLHFQDSSFSRENFAPFCFQPFDSFE
jgi:non-lysosomal glucosylceramidase